MSVFYTVALKDVRTETFLADKKAFEWVALMDGIEVASMAVWMGDNVGKQMAEMMVMNKVVKSVAYLAYC